MLLVSDDDTKRGTRNSENKERRDPRGSLTFKVMLMTYFKAIKSVENGEPMLSGGESIVKVAIVVEWIELERAASARTFVSIIVSKEKERQRWWLNLLPQHPGTKEGNAS